MTTNNFSQPIGIGESLQEYILRQAHEGNFEHNRNIAFFQLTYGRAADGPEGRRLAEVLINDVKRVPALFKAMHAVWSKTPQWVKDTTKGQWHSYSTRSYGHFEAS